MMRSRSSVRPPKITKPLQLSQDALAVLASYPELNPNPIAEIDSTGRIRMLNPAAATLFPTLRRRGLKHPFLVGVDKLYPKLLRQQSRRLNREVRVDASTYLQTIIIPPKQPKVIRIYSSDITDQKQNEDQLRQAQRMAHIGNWTLDLMTNELTWSDEIYRIFEIDPNKFGASYEAFLAAIHPDDRQAVDDAYTESLRTKKPYHIEHRLLFADGRIKYVHEECETLYTSLGKPQRSIGTVQDITEQKLAEQKLRHRDHLLYEAQRVANIGSWHWDAIKDVITWSDQYHRIVGLPVDQPPPNYEEHMKYYTAESAARLDAAVKVALKKGTPYELELNLIHPAGVHKWLLARGEAIRNERGKIVALQGTILDITDQKNLEHEIQTRNRALTVISSGNRAQVHAQSEEELLQDMCNVLVQQGAYRMAWIGYLVHDDRRSVRAVASAGYTNGYLETAKITWSDTPSGRGPTGTCIRTKRTVVAQDLTTQPAFDTWRPKALKMGYASSIALPLLVNGDIIGALSVYAAEANAFGPAEQHLLEEFATDISYGISIMRLRVQQQHTEAELQDNADQINDLYQHAPCGYHSLDKNAVYVRINDTELDMLGYRRDEVIGKKKFSDFLTPEGVAQFKKRFSLFLERGVSVGAEYEMIRKDGTKFPVTISATSILDDSGAFIASRAVVLDISDRKQIDEKTKELDVLKNNYIRVVSQQLQAPLDVIRWNLETLLNRERGLLEPPQEELLRTTHAANLMIISRLNDLRLAMEIEEQRLPLERTRVQISTVLQKASEKTAHLCAKKHIQFQIRFPNNPLPMISGDEQKLRDAIERLLDNAVSYTSKNGSIRVTTQLRDGNIHCEIADSGIGIPVSDQPHIFERFYRGYRASQLKPEASGLGLFIAKYIVEAHGGTIGFTSSENKGSTFWFELPLA